MPHRAGSSLYSFLASSMGSKTGPETGLGRENGRRRGQVREGARPAVPRTRSDSGSAGPPCSPAQAEARAESPPARATPVAARGRCPLRAERPRPLASPIPLSRLWGQLLHTARLRGAAMCVHSCACACACAPITRLCVDMLHPAASQRMSPLWKRRDLWRVGHQQAGDVTTCPTGPSFHSP